MRKFLSLCFLSFACGAPDAAPEPLELGQAEQALSMAVVRRGKTQPGGKRGPDVVYHADAALLA